MYWRSFFVKHKNRLTLFSLIFLTVILLIFGIVYHIKNSDEISVVSDARPGVVKGDGRDNSIIIHVKGAVNSPGLYEISRGSRVNDAVATAGGFSENADTSDINLAEFVDDGEEVFIPEIKIGGEESEVNDGKKNINTASREELMTLPGIGEAFAERIINYREKHGGFKKIEDLMRVTGIGANKFNDIKDKVKIR